MTQLDECCTVSPASPCPKRSKWLRALFFVGRLGVVLLACLAAYLVNLGDFEVFWFTDYVWCGLCAFVACLLTRWFLGVPIFLSLVGLLQYLFFSFVLSPFLWRNPGSFLPGARFYAYSLLVTLLGASIAYVLLLVVPWVRRKLAPGDTGERHISTVRLPHGRTVIAFVCFNLAVIGGMYLFFNPASMRPVLANYNELSRLSTTELETIIKSDASESDTDRQMMAVLLLPSSTTDKAEALRVLGGIPQDKSDTSDLARAAKTATTRASVPVVDLPMSVARWYSHKDRRLIETLVYLNVLHINKTPGKLKAMKRQLIEHLCWPFFE